MEPTIYKPGANKSPGIYNCAGGIYKGSGVYNYGAGVSPVPPIPPEYQLVEYIKLFNRTTINTGVKFLLNDTLYAKLRYFNYTAERYNVIFGSRTSSGNPDQFTIFGKRENVEQITLTEGVHYGLLVSSIPNDSFKIICTKDYVEVLNNEEQIIGSYNIVNRSWTGCVENMYIAQVNDNMDQCSNLYMYEFVIKDENNEDKLHLYPVKRILDNVFGAYDVVNNRFLTQAQGGPILGPT